MSLITKDDSLITKDDIKKIKMGDDGTFTIIKDLNVKAQVMFCTLFDALIVEKDDGLYYVKRIKKGKSFEVTPFPFRNMTKELLIEMVEEAVDLRIRKNDLFSYRKIENLFNKEDTWFCNLKEEE